MNARPHAQGKGLDLFSVRFVVCGGGVDMRVKLVAYLGDGSGGASEKRGILDSSPRDHCSGGVDSDEEGEEVEDGIDVEKFEKGDGL